MGELIVENFEYEHNNTAMDKAWNLWFETVRPNYTFDEWMRQTYNLEVHWFNRIDIKVIGEDKDLTLFLLRWS